MQRRKDVGVELFQQGVAVGVQDGAHGAVAGVIDQQIQPTCLAANLLDALLALLRVVDVQGDGDRALGGQWVQGFDAARRSKYLIVGFQAGQG